MWKEKMEKDTVICYLRKKIKFFFAGISYPYMDP